MQKFDVQSLLQKLAEMQVRPNKKLGQNFLINQDTCERIVDGALKFSPTHIVEVGPGLGALTEIVIGRKIPLTLIELDRTFAEYWQNKNIQTIHADALQMDWNDLHLPEKSLLLSNLPYQISSSIVVERSIYPCHIEYMVLMFQKEVAQRMQAKPQTPDYGMLSVVAQAYWKISNTADVGAKDFYPPPQIASRVLTFVRKNSGFLAPTLVEKSEKFLVFVKAAFAQRRKFLVKNLSSFYEKTLLLEKFGQLKISDKARAEDLSVAQFVELFSSLE